MSKTLQLLRNASLYSDKTSALSALQTKLSSSSDGEIVLARYSDDDGAIESLIGVAYSDGTDTGYTIVDAAGIAANIEELQDALESLTSTVTANAVQSSDGTIVVDTTSSESTDITVNIDGDTLVKDDSGVISVASAALTQYEGENAIEISETDSSTNTKTVSLTISDEDTILSQDESGLFAVLSLSYSSDDKKIYLYGKDTTNAISEIDATDFIKDGMLSSAELYTATSTDTSLEEGHKYVVLTFNDEGGDTIYLDVNDLVDVYTGGDGISVSDANVISVVVDDDSETFLSVSSDGLSLSGVQEAIDSAQAAATTTVSLSSDSTHITLTESTDTNGSLSYVIGESDIASASDLSSEITRATAAEEANSGEIAAIETAVGLSSDGSYVATSGTYTASASTIAEALSLLEAQVVSNTESIASNADSVTSTIESLDMDEVGGTGYMVTTVSETDGVVSATAVLASADNISATATDATSTAVAVEGSTVAEQIVSLATSIQSVSDAAISVAAGDGISTSTSGTTVTVTAVAASDDPIIEVTSSGIATKEDAEWDCGSYDEE